MKASFIMREQLLLLMVGNGWQPPDWDLCKWEETGGTFHIGGSLVVTIKPRSL